MKNIKLRKYFYILTAISIIVFVLGFIIDDFMLEIFKLDISKIQKFKLADFMIFIPFCMWVWLILFGLIFVPKNWKVWLMLLVLLIPHCLFIIIFSYYHSIADIFKVYIYFLSFMILRV